jgi:hypothetical protein
VVFRPAADEEHITVTWNYRLVRHRKPKTWFGLHEVYYDASGRPSTFNEELIDFVIDTGGLQGAKDGNLRQALADAERFPVIDETEFGAP